MISSCDCGCDDMGTIRLIAAPACADGTECRVGMIRQSFKAAPLRWLRRNPLSVVAFGACDQLCEGRRVDERDGILRRVCLRLAAEVARSHINPAMRTSCAHGRLQIAQRRNASVRDF